METNKKHYEDLIRWVMKDIRYLDKQTKKLASNYFNSYLITTVSHLDIHGVIQDNEDFVSFKKDIMNRIAF